MSKLSFVPVNYNSSGTDSDSINTEGMQLIGVICSSAISSTALSFKAAINRFPDATWKTVTNSTGGTISVTVASSAYIALKQDESAQLNTIEYLKFVAGASEAKGVNFTGIFQPRRQS